MKLQSADGASLSLSIMGYQFPYDGPPTAGLDTDANWLMVHGAVTPAGGEGFKFTDPCLMTAEADELGDWLRAVALGRIDATDDPEEGTGLLFFTEPNLAFSVSTWNAETATIRVHLSAEATPPWAKPDAELFETVLALHVTNAALIQAADEWAGETATYPLR